LDIEPYRLGFAVKVLGAGGLKTHDSRRWQSGPHLSRSLELLDPVLDYLDRVDVRVYRLSSATVPYGTHPDLPELDYRRQLDACAPRLAELGAKAARLRLRLSTHPGQYTVLNSTDEAIAAKARADVEQDALLLDALGQPDEAVVIVHVGGVYGDRPAALDRWARAYERLSDGARRRLVVEHDERGFDLGDTLELHRRVGVRVVFDSHHHRCNPWAGAPRIEEALPLALGTWPAGVRPKVHVSSPRTEFRAMGRAPLLDQHSDFPSPWDVAAVVRSAPCPLDVMLEAKAKDLAVLWARTQLERVDPAVAAAEERSGREPPEREPEDGVADARLREGARVP
jgi:UV DNA damage endonuclease